VPARIKEPEVRSWDFSFATDAFTVLIYSSDNLSMEMDEIRTSLGQSLVIDEVALVLPILMGEQEQFKAKVRRKSEKGLAYKERSINFEERVQRKLQRALEDFLSGDCYFRKIEITAPAIFLCLAM